MFLIDSHCHIDSLDYAKKHKNIDEVLKKAISNNVKFFLNISTSINHFKKMCKKIGDRYNVRYSCGIHPLKCTENYKYNYDELYNLSKQKNVIGIGETGLDYFYNFQYRNLQIDLFRKHIQISTLLNKPIIIHARNSMKDIINILNESSSKRCKGVIHSFTEDLFSLKKVLDLGFYISLSGIVTFKSATKLRSILKYIPIDRLLLETDSPYLAPTPYRGKENQPAYLYYLSKHISLLLNKKIFEIAKVTKNNFEKLFHIKLNL